MKTTTLFAALVLIATALAMIPSSQAMQTPPPCQTMTGSCCGIEPSFAPCCSVLSCPPQPYCMETGVYTSDFLAYLGPHAGVTLLGDCSVEVCQTATNTCCSIDGKQSSCGTVQLCVPPLASTAMALPIPRVAYTFNPDCSVTVTETYDCPPGFWDTTIYRTIGPVHLVADSCAPMCACMPMSVAFVPEVFQ